ALESCRRRLVVLLLLLEIVHVSDIPEELTIAESRLDQRTDVLIEIGIAVAYLNQEFVEGLFLIFAFVLLQDRFELFLQRGRLGVEARHNRGCRLVVAVEEEDDRL